MCEESEEVRDLGLLQSRCTQHLTFLYVIKPIGTQLWKGRVPGKTDTRDFFISSVKTSKMYFPILQDPGVLKNQTCSCGHCLIYLTKEWKPQTKVCHLTLPVLNFPMSREGNERQRGKDRCRMYLGEVGAPALMEAKPALDWGLRRSPRCAGTSGPFSRHGLRLSPPLPG